MSFPRIAYNGKTIDLDSPLPSVMPDAVSGVSRVSSTTGHRQTLLVNTETAVEAVIGGYRLGNATDEAVRRKLMQWREWAQAGYPWTFAQDASKSAITTTTAGTAAGAVVVALAATAGLVAGDPCVIRSEIHQETVAIASVDSGVQVTLAETLNFSYPNGSRFRHFGFWPARLVSSENPIQADSNTSWALTLRFIEDVNAL